MQRNQAEAERQRRQAQERERARQEKLRREREARERKQREEWEKKRREEEKKRQEQQRKNWLKRLAEASEKRRKEMIDQQRELQEKWRKEQWERSQREARERQRQSVEAARSRQQALTGQQLHHLQDPQPPAAEQQHELAIRRGNVSSGSWLSKLMSLFIGTAHAEPLRTANTSSQKVSKILPTPKIVEQNSDLDCWAAALESWLDHIGLHHRTRDQLLKDFPEAKEGFKNKDLRDMLLLRYDMKTEWMSFNDFSVKNIQQTLEFGPVYVGIDVTQREGKPLWHAVVLYGVTKLPTGDVKYHVMNPDRGKIQKWSHDDFFRHSAESKVLLGWKFRKVHRGK